ncbi:hypothetical protein ACQP1U_03155 [Actinomycetota bacterium]
MTATHTDQERPMTTETMPAVAPTAPSTASAPEGHDPATASARRLWTLALIGVAVLAPLALAAAQWPGYWRWIAAEQTPMTWLQSVVLVLAGVGAFLTAHVLRLLGERPWPWLVLGAGFTFLALDERFAIHERVRDGILAPRGVSIPFLPWVAPGDFLMMGVALVGLALLPGILRALAADRAARRALLVGVALAAVAVGMDSLDPSTMTQGQERLEQTLEECLECAAGLAFLCAVGLRLLGAIGRATARHAMAATPGRVRDNG